MSCLDVWVAAFDRLSDALEDYVACCQSVNEVPPAAEEITGVDGSTGAPEYDREADEHPTEYADSEAYDAYLCGVAHRMAEKMDGAVDTVYDIILTTSNILVFATLVVLAFANVIGMGVAAVLAGGYSLVSLGEIWGFHSAMTNLRTALGGGDPQGLVPQTKAELSAASDDIVDAIFCANDAPAATAALHGVFDANVTSGSYRAILKLMFNGLVMRAAFAGFVNVPDRFDCECGIDFDFISESTFDTGNEGWSIVDGNTRRDFNFGDCVNDWALGLAGTFPLRTGPGSQAGHAGESFSNRPFLEQVEIEMCHAPAGAVYHLTVKYVGGTSTVFVIDDGPGSYVFSPDDLEIRTTIDAIELMLINAGAGGGHKMTRSKFWWRDEV